LASRRQAFDDTIHNLALAKAAVRFAQSRAPFAGAIRSPDKSTQHSLFPFMKINPLSIPTGEIAYAQEHADGSATKLRGALFAGFTTTEEPAPVARRLAPSTRLRLLCIGLNYRQHAAETNTPLPKFPILFSRTSRRCSIPASPSSCRAGMRSGSVDYECELRSSSAGPRRTSPAPTRSTMSSVTPVPMT